MKIRGMVALIGLASLLVLGAACGNGESGTPGDATPPQAGVSVPAPAAPAPAAPTQSSLPAPAAPATEPAVTELPVPLTVPVPAPAEVEAPAVEPAPPVQAPSGSAVVQAGGVSTQGYSPLLQVASSQAGIWVTGLGTISLEPDLSVVTIGVETEAVTVAEARDKAATAMAAIVEAVKSYGLTDRDVQTRSFNIYPVYEYPEVIELGRTTRKQVLVGYRVSNTASIKIRNLDDVGPIIDDVADAGGDATRINGISFTVEDTSPFMTQLREDAVNDALAKAEQFASLTGVSVGSLVYISELGGGTPVALPTMERTFAVAAAAAPTTSISGGGLELRLSVQVVFNIQ
jgi:uncharacterized protein YggE